MRERHLPRTATALAALTLACISSTEPPRTITLEADLVPAEATVDPVTGSMALVIGTGQTQVGLGVQGAVSGARLGWALRNGTCDGSGDRVGPAGAFPPIEASSEGTGSSQTTIFRRIPDDVRYAGEVFAGEDGTGEVLACADFDPRT